MNLDVHAQNTATGIFGVKNKSHMEASAIDEEGRLDQSSE